MIWRLDTDALQGATLEGVAANEPTPELSGITDNGTRDNRDREKKCLSELVARLHEAFGKAISDKDKVAFAVLVPEQLRGDAAVMAQVQNNPRDQATRAELPKAAIKASSAAMLSHREIATKRLGPDEARRVVFLSAICESLRNGVLGDLFGMETR